MRKLQHVWMSSLTWADVHWDLSSRVQHSDQQLSLFFPSFLLALVVSPSFCAEPKVKKRWCLAEWKRALEGKVPYKSLPAPSPPPSCTSLFQPSALCHLCFPSLRPRLLHSFIQTHTCSHLDARTHTHTLAQAHTLKSVTVTDAVSVQPLCCECNQAAQCHCPPPQIVVYLFFHLLCHYLSMWCRFTIWHLTCLLSPCI